MPGRESLPSTLRRSPAKAQRTWAEVHDSAVEQYGEGEQAHRTAFAVVKQGFEKVGDRWEPKRRRGPSDPRSTLTTAEKRRNRGETYGGVDVLGHTRDELMERAARLGIRGRSRMRKAELGAAIARAQS